MRVLEYKQVISIELDYEKFMKDIFNQMEINDFFSKRKKIFYGMEDLVELTSFSKGHINNTFFLDPRFKKIRRKIGRKWAFPVDETEVFLNEWIREQPHD